jgi:hypothetical protein
MDGADCLSAIQLLKSAFWEYSTTLATHMLSGSGTGSGSSSSSSSFSPSSSSSGSGSHAALPLLTPMQHALLVVGEQDEETLQIYGHITQTKTASAAREMFADQDEVWTMAALLHTFADTNMDGWLSPTEAFKMFQLQGEDFKVLTASFGETQVLSKSPDPSRGVPVEALVDALMAGRRLLGVADRQLSSISEDVAAMVFRLLDLDNDAILSPVEIRPLQLDGKLRQGMMVDSEGISLQIWQKLQQEPVTDCSKLIVVDHAGAFDINSLWLPRGKCNILVLPNFKVPVQYESSSDSFCAATPPGSTAEDRPEFDGEHCPQWREFVYDTDCG